MSHSPEMPPVQPVVKDKTGSRRFRANAVVRALLDRSGLDLDQLVALDPSFSREDHEQIAQLLGCPMDDDLFVRIQPHLPEPVTLKKGGYQPQPMQPVIQDAHGVLRFRQNAIVRALLDRDTEGLNWTGLQGFSQADEEQFAQLIGYSISGYHELSYVSNKSAAQASARGHEILPGAGGCRDAGCPIHGGPLGS